MTEEQVDGIRSRLSAIVTNHQTCYDGLVVAKSGILRSRLDGTEAALSAPEIFNVRRLYSVSSGLVTQALISTNSTHHRHHHHHHHHHQHHHNHRKRDNVKGGGLPPATPPSQNVKGGSGNRLPPAAVAPVNLHRQPLEQFIKALKSTNCNSSSSKSCPREGQIQLGMEGSGILIRDIVIVSKDGTGNFTTIRDAVANLPNNTRPEDGYFVIYVKQGIYEEIIDISRYKKNIMLLGDGINRTVITGNLNAGDGQLHTFYTATFAVSGDRFIAIDITFRNTAGPTKGQAVAVRNQADLSAFYRCSLEGYQDTLYAHSRRQFYRECDIYGNVDFIFGDAAAVFQNCNIFVRNTRNHKTNYITAQGREDPDSNTGISIHNCTVDVAPDSATSRRTRTYLGRPWQLYSRTVYMQSYIGSLVAPAGWSKWNNGNTGLDTLYYGEFENYGPGANTRRRVRWPGFSLMSDSEALNFTVSNFTTGWSWLPDTDIPFSAGLIETT
ncbi:probable pectinesterase/pectinesterase inhibitor 25 [Morus notabilis]|uniref:probable pectinesterase/pectinesterase inhibitor 25 n=1 Tax=Morus notabilis TaxID=981085 RepID=UPI000CECE93D|nr:probable pectinesterase/pectinesterase inhibitor 25 [Morus notabilis]